MELENPFTPTFGEIPAHLAGRRHIIQSILRAFESERRRPELTSIFSGARGTGKTTLLSLLANQAEERGWLSVSATAMPGMLDDLEIGIRRNAAHLVDAKRSKKISGIDIANVGGIAFSDDQQDLSNWRSRVSDLLDALAEQNVGLLITVDEVDPKLDEMRELAAVYQHFIREDRKVALLMAGLPYNIDALLSDKTVSFLRRAQSFELGQVADYEVKHALLQTIEGGGRSADKDGVAEAVCAISGFPFMIQLVGFRSWDVNSHEQLISKEDFETGIVLAKQEMDDRILRATYNDLSDADLKFLKAMLEDEGHSAIGDIRERLGWSAAQASQYKLRLLKAGVISERNRGAIEFAIPFFRDYLARC